MPERLPSLELIVDEVHTELIEQLRRFESVDAKAGLVLGFAGVLVAISANRSGPTGDIGLCLAVSAGLLALFAFQPRKFPVLDVVELRHQYLGAERAFTTLHLLDSRLEMWKQGIEVLRSKSYRLKLALAFLVAAAVALAGGILWD